MQKTRKLWEKDCNQIHELKVLPQDLIDSPHAPSSSACYEAGKAFLCERAIALIPPGIVKLEGKLTACPRTCACGPPSSAAPPGGLPLACWSACSVGKQCQGGFHQKKTGAAPGVGRKTMHRSGASQKDCGLFEGQTRRWLDVGTVGKGGLHKAR
eukprot:1155746-Pelagomonas_calceolata.AAC.10